jgi:hypothetical protein
MIGHNERAAWRRILGGVLLRVPLYPHGEVRPRGTVARAVYGVSSSSLTCGSSHLVTAACEGGEKNVIVSKLKPRLWASF